eukprot:GEMP01008029.1.p1 GENE.GEMP01008029.1~~GEMP01008029.1.p1  ORF type:complete len:711 (+),score=159.94 GEMP01008029.1:279-2411(+)
MSAASRPVSEEGTRHTPLARYYLRDTRSTGDLYYATITAMNGYQHKSLEELRFEDYRLGNATPHYGFPTTHSTGTAASFHVMEAPSPGVNSAPNASIEGINVNHAPSNNSRCLIKAPPACAADGEDGGANTTAVRRVKPPPPPLRVNIGQQATLEPHAVGRSKEPPLPPATSPPTPPRSSTVPSSMPGASTDQPVLIKAPPMKAPPTQKYDSRQAKSPPPTVYVNTPESGMYPIASTDPSPMLRASPRTPPSDSPPPPPTTPLPPSSRPSWQMNLVSPVAPPPPRPQLSYQSTTPPSVSLPVKALPPKSSPPSIQVAKPPHASRPGPPSSYKPRPPSGSPPPSPAISSLSAPPSSTQGWNDVQGTLPPVCAMASAASVRPPRQNGTSKPAPTNAPYQPPLNPSSSLPSEAVTRPLVAPQEAAASAVKVPPPLRVARPAPPPPPQTVENKATTLPLPNVTWEAMPGPSHASPLQAPINRSTKPPPPSAPRLAQPCQHPTDAYAPHRSPPCAESHLNIPSPPHYAPPRHAAASTASAMPLQPPAPGDKRTPTMSSKPAPPTRTREGNSLVATTSSLAVADPVPDRHGTTAVLVKEAPPLHQVAPGKKEPRPQGAPSMPSQESAENSFSKPESAHTMSCGPHHTAPLATVSANNAVHIPVAMKAPPFEDGRKVQIDVMNKCVIKAAPSPFPGVFSNCTRPPYKQPIFPFTKCQ